MQTPPLERVSRTVTCASVAVLVLALLTVHPDLTVMLQAGAAVAFLLGLLAGRTHGQYAQTACVLAAPLAPALLRIVAGREGPVLDIVWMAGLAGALLRSVSWSRWALPPFWRVLVGGWALALALVWPLLVAREIGFEPAGLTDAGAIVSWADWSTAPWSAPRAAGWILYWVLTQLLGVLWFDWLRARFADRDDGIPPAAHALWVGGTIASLVAMVQGTIDLSLLSSDFWAERGRAAGTLLDANGYGHVAALAGPIAFLAMRRLRPQAAVPAWLMLAVNWLGVWMSGSRTALLCAVLGAVGLSIGAWRSPEAVASGRRRAAAVALVTGAAILILIAGAIGPLRRLSEIPAERASLAALWDRGGYGSIAVQMMREYPLTGTGAGTFHYLAPDYWRIEVNDTLPADNAQNWWRHQAAELGLLGGLPILVFSLLVAWRVIAVRGAAGAPRGATPTVRALLIGLGASSFFGVPTQSPIVLLWFFFLVAWLDVLVPSPFLPSRAVAGWTRAGWAAAIVLAIAYAGVHLALARSSLSVLERARRFSREYVVGAQPLEPLGDGRFRWTGAESHFYLPAQTPWLVLRLWAHHPDIAGNPVRVTVSTPCGVLWEDWLRNIEPVTIGVALPEGTRSFEASVRVSRTWRPSDYGQEDTRRLGVGIATEFTDSPGLVQSRMYTPVWPVCDNSLLPTARRSLQ